jgi:hypothetical protein
MQHSARGISTAEVRTSVKRDLLFRDPVIPHMRAGMRTNERGEEEGRGPRPFRTFRTPVIPHMRAGMRTNERGEEEGRTKDRGEVAHQ